MRRSGADGGGSELQLPDISLQISSKVLDGTGPEVELQLPVIESAGVAKDNLPTALPWPELLHVPDCLDPLPFAIDAHETEQISIEHAGTGIDLASTGTASTGTDRSQESKRGVLGGFLLCCSDRSMPTDPQGKSEQFRIISFQYPHMRSFHMAWFSFFISFVAWFSIPPLLATIKLPACDTDNPLCSEPQCQEGFDYARSSEFADEQQWKRRCGICFPYGSGTCGGLGLSHPQIVASNVGSVAITILLRVAIGPIADRVGPRLCQLLLLSIFSIPVFLAGTVQNYSGFMIARLFIGCIGACFVVTQMWTSLMFAQTIIGTANATSAGWGNLGAGVAQGLMPAIFMGFKNNGYDNNDAWRSTLFVPGGICCIVGFMAYLLGSDCPQGNYQQLRRQGENHGIPMLHSLRLAVGDPRTWLLHLHYAVCFGFELAVNGNLALHFHNVFDFSQTTAGAAAAAFGMMNIFARTMGGALSDICSKQFGLVRGRVCSLFVCLVFEGVFLVLFSRVRRGEWGGFGTAMVFMVMFSCCVQMAEGCTFALVPFVNPTAIGGVAGIVGAGGSVGAVSANTLFLNGSNTAFLVMGFICLGVSFTVPLLLFFKFREN